jgi:glycosyltransferase involved in cell wall biosynthesis
MISCLTVTQEGRLEGFARVLADFQAQSAAEKELVVVHNGAAAFHDGVSALVAQGPDAPVRVMRVPGNPTLGALRNIAVDEAHGEYVCQWDDDDRYHPLRLEAQLDALLSDKADFSYLSDVIHLFADTREAYWDDWFEQPWPINVMPATLFGRRNLMARYPEIPRGEDSELSDALLRQGRTFARMREHGYLYVYIYHGRNTFDLVHHAMISRSRRFHGARLRRLEPLLRARLAEYSPPLGPFTMPDEGGTLEFH